MAMDIQVVYQGGGARVVHLLAAYERLAELETHGKIAVKGVAGTSAGAIIAALHALRINPELVKQKFEFTGRDLLGKLQRPSTLGALLKFWRRRSIWDLSKIRVFLEGVIPSDRRFRDAKIPLAIVCSDLKGKKAVTTTRETNQGQDFILDSVLDSISIPIAFRVWN